MLKGIQDRALVKLKTLVYKAGFKIERIPDKGNFIKNIYPLTDNLKRYEIKKLCRTLSIVNDHHYYNKILEEYIPEWKNTFSHTKFIGFGLGEYNLNVYRKVSENQVHYFEKIYYADSIDFRRMEWFYNYIYPKINHKIKTIKLHKIYKGQLLNAAYFEYANLEAIEEEQWESEFIKSSKLIYTLTSEIQDLFPHAPDYVSDFRLHDLYVQNISRTKTFLAKESRLQLTTEGIEKQVSLSPKVLTHGDIYEHNLFKSEYLIDWDSCGLYPIGVEFAFVLGRSKEPCEFSTLLQRIKKEYEKLVAKRFWKNWEFNCLYFFLLSSMQHTSTPKLLRMQIDILNYLESLYLELNNFLKTGIKNPGIQPS